MTDIRDSFEKWPLDGGVGSSGNGSEWCHHGLRTILVKMFLVHLFLL